MSPKLFTFTLLKLAIGYFNRQFTKITKKTTFFYFTLLVSKNEVKLNCISGAHALEMTFRKLNSNISFQKQRPWFPR